MILELKEIEVRLPRKEVNEWIKPEDELLIHETIHKNLELLNEHPIEFVFDNSSIMFVTNNPRISNGSIYVDASALINIKERDANERLADFISLGHDNGHMYIGANFKIYRKILRCELDNLTFNFKK